VPLRALLFLAFCTVLQTQPEGTIAGRVQFEDFAAPAVDLVIHCIARRGSPSQRVLTDSDGRYECRVPAGVYRIRAELSRLDPQYLSQTYGIGQPGDDEGRGIRVRANDRVEVPFVLRRSGTISGRVVDDHGSPVRDAVVRVQREPTDTPTLGTSSMETAATLDGGHFSIAGLAPGVYHLSADPPARLAIPDKDGRRLVPTWYPAANDPRDAVPVRVNGDDLAGVELRLARSRLAAVRGVVVRADGSPAGETQVSLAVGDARSVSLAAVTSGSRGDFVFESVVPGAYQLAASAGREPLEAANLALIVAESDITDLVLPLRSASIHGRVRFEGKDFPAASMSVEVRALEALAMSFSTRTDVKWEFFLSPPGGLRIIRVAGLPKGWWLKSVTGARRHLTNHPVDFSDGLEGVEILVSRRMSTLGGDVRIVDPEATELPADTAVLIFSHDPSHWFPGSTAVSRVWPTLEGQENGREIGRFLAEGLPAGEYHVIAVDATPAGFLRVVPDVLRRLAPHATLVTLGDGGTHQVVLSLVRRD
jgi:hypothetical protein